MENIVINWKKNRLLLEAREFGRLKWSSVAKHHWEVEAVELINHGLLVPSLGTDGAVLTPAGVELCDKKLWYLPPEERPNNRAYCAMMGWRLPDETDGL